MADDHCFLSGSYLLELRPDGEEEEEHFWSSMLKLSEPFPKTEKRRAMCRNGRQTDKCNLEGMEWRSFTNAEYQTDKRNG